MTDTFFEVNLKANVIIESTQAFKDLVEKVGKILQIQFQKDDSGYTEECPSYICNPLNLAIRLTGNSYEDTNHFEKGNELKSLTRIIHTPTNCSGFEAMRSGSEMIPIKLTL